MHGSGNHRIVSQALVLAIGVRETGEREILGFAVGASEEEAFWQEFLRSLVRRGLKGVRLVISDAHEGLKAAIAQVLAGSTWQRCRVHPGLAPGAGFMRNLLAHVPQGDKAMVAAAVRTIFAQPNHQAARQQLAEVVQAMRPRWSKASELLAAAETEIPWPACPGRAGLHELSPGPLGSDLLHEPPGTSDSGGPPTYQRRGGVP